MTTGYFFNGTTLGDADQAPYDDTEVAAPLARLGSFVVPDASDELKVTPGSTGTVSLSAGRAMVNGYFYVNDADEEIGLASAANNRIDRIVLRADVSAQTVSLVVITGTAAATPAVPALTAEDFALAQVWVPSGFDSGADTIDDADIHDERVFDIIGSQQKYPSYDNLIINSEYLVRPGNDTVPAYWYEVGGPGSVTFSEGPNLDQARTYALNIVTSNTSQHGMEQASRWLTEGETYTVKGRIDVAAGEWTMVLTGTGGALVTKTYNAQSDYIDILERFVADGSVISLSIYTIGTNGAEADIGQFMLTPGKIGGAFTEVHEWVLNQTTYEVDASWNTTAKSSGETSLTVASTFSNSVNAYVRGLILGLRGRDSGSAANADIGLHITSVALGGIRLSSLYVGGDVNDKMRENIGYAPISVAGTQIRLKVVASGAGTFDAEVRIVGAIT